MWSHACTREEILKEGGIALRILPITGRAVESYQSSKLIPNLHQQNKLCLPEGTVIRPLLQLIMKRDHLSGKKTRVVWRGPQPPPLHRQDEASALSGFYPPDRCVSGTGLPATHGLPPAHPRLRDPLSPRPVNGSVSRTSPGPGAQEAWPAPGAYEAVALRSPLCPPLTRIVSGGNELTCLRDR